MLSKRIQKELKNLQEENLTYIEASPNDGDLLNWTAYIEGPPDSSYEDGRFKINISFPDKYPFRPPKLFFETPIFHPNIGKKGSICLDILQNNWSPALSITRVLLSLLSLLTDPNPDDPLRGDAASLYNNDKEKYDKRVRKEVKKYALKSKKKLAEEDSKKSIKKTNKKQVDEEKEDEELEEEELEEEEEESEE